MDGKRCPCGLPLHYNNPHLEALVEEIINKKGQFALLMVDGREWRIPHHYLALHGKPGLRTIKRLGFEEVPKTKAATTG